ncbi:Sec-independent protein translocase TatB [Bisgaardia hudsonensis]|uniref:Sec-independent protein translocase protein TatB n=1 Tax=Bisgaardia hudsonensis TaxID=109472 RepID=A0A4R2N285_9PAST|nr:Sec-independent protein translocase protein TatB [Bisgaardia hudsonensis]QLB12424.1 twin arginine-targeting protein translocase TatB [Bisgaardia hudsonensis]TCP13953.1 Sec-independent protein translocase TatB [Bisgaardia hudsonensis]
MFDIGFSELILIFVVGLVVLGPQRLPIAIRTVMGWVRTIRGLAANVQSELSQELKLQELQESIKKAEKLNIQQLSPELAQTVEELKVSAQKVKADLERKASETGTDLQKQVTELKNRIEQEDNSENTKNSTALSPEEIAELAEEDEEMVYLNEDYYPDDTLADVNSSQSLTTITDSRNEHTLEKDALDKKEKV